MTKTTKMVSVKKNARARIPRGIRQYMTTSFKQHVRLLNLTWVGADLFGALSYQLSDIPGYTNFTTVWDEYRITKVELFFKSIFQAAPVGTFNVATGVTANVNVQPFLILANDYTDTTTPTENILLTHEDCALKGSMENSYTHTVNPIPLGALYQGAFTGYGREDGQWVEANSAGVNHYGTKYGIVAGSNVNSINYPIKVWATYWLEFRKVVG